MADWHSDDGELVVGWFDDCNDVPPLVFELELELLVLAGDEAAGILLVVLLLVYCKLNNKKKKRNYLIVTIIFKFKKVGTFFHKYIRYIYLKVIF